MRTGIVISTFGMADPLAGIVAAAARAEADGLSSAWVTQGTGVDALTALALAGAATHRIELGVAVVPVQTRHPISLAQAARTTQLATSGRVTLGVGLSHRPFVEGVLGLPFERPVAQLDGYLDVLLPALEGAEPVNVPGVAAPPVLLAALGPRMLQLAAQRTTGTVTWLTGRRTMRDHIVPTIRAAAEDAGRPRPRVLCAIPVCVTDDRAGGAARADERLAYTARMPSYRSMMAREGITSPGEMALIGDEHEVGALLDELEAAGVDDVLAIELAVSPDDARRTRDLIAARAAR